MQFSSITPLLAVLLVTTQGYKHPPQLLDELRQAEATSKQLHIDGKHELYSLYDDFKQLTPEKVFRQLVHLSKSNGGVDYEISELCSNQTIYLLENLRIPDMNPAHAAMNWADNVLDAWGKPGSSILQLGLKWLGDFDECLAVQSLSSNPNISLPHYLDFEGKYCTVGAASGSALMGMANPFGGGLSLGTCFASGCSEKDVSAVLSSLIHTISKNYTSHISVTCQERDMEYSNAAIATIVVYCVMGALCLIATLYDFIFIMMTPDPEEDDDVPVLTPSNGHANGDLRKVAESDTEILISSHEKPSAKQEHSKFGEFLMCFSLYTNGYKILSTKQAAGSLNCLNGIRFISMLWVILGHTIVFNITSLKNLLTIFSWTKRWTFQVVENATVSVDSFFVLSGLLTAYLFLKELDKKKMGVLKFLVTVPIMYLHRYVRLTPAFGFMIMFYTYLGLYTFTGPMKPTGTTVMDPYCVNNSWAALLYVNNVIEPLHMCAGWSWYLANDFQFYLVTPFVVYIMYRSPTVGMILSSIMIVTSAAAATGVSVKDDLGLGMMGGRTPDTPPGQGKQMQDLYFAPWTRYQSYGVGVLFGYILFHCYSKYNGRLPINRATNLILWAVSGATMLCVLYGPHDAETFVHIASKAEAAFYNGWNRTAWSLALGYIILACCTGRGGWVNEFLSWPGFVPVSRMTYCAYLVHPVIMSLVSISHKSLDVWSEITFIYMFAAYSFLAFAVGFLFSIVFEAPFMLLDKKYLTGKLSKLSCSC